MSNQFSISTLSDQLSQLRPSSRSSYQQSHGHPLLFRNLNLEAESLYRTLLPSRDELGQRQDLIRRLSSVVTSKVKKWIKESLELEHDVEILLEQFGSTMAGFDMSGADVDLCLIIPDLIKNEDDEKFQNLDVKKLLVFVGDVLENDCAMADVKVLENARVPIVKYRDPVSGISGDIGYQNILALWNTRLLRAYADVDYRFRPLAFLVKYWAKRRHINDPYNGTLSSYSYVLLLIHYLQITSPPVLPNLQRLPPSRGQTLTTRIIQGYNTYFFEPTAPDASDHHIFQSPWTFDPLHSVWILKEKNTQSIGELLAGFMHYYAQDFNFFEDVVSIRAGDVISKEGKGWLKVENKDAMTEPEKGTAVDGGDVGDDENDAQIADVKENENKPAKDKPKNDRYWFCIEDPFETTHNLGRVLTKRS
ncbi:hypothetical protein BKA69DRAFT_1072513 [Paraphysoderma sedebokerense]|nr:hypothetical protein BKA69DRAFT_1072513 [Paraphysoderma sedebokerense]